jgi:hypothetical protein
MKQSEQTLSRLISSHLVLRNPSPAVKPVIDSGFIPCDRRQDVTDLKILLR